jgi:2-dehydropantoate 2-reductase
MTIFLARWSNPTIPNGSIAQVIPTRRVVGCVLYFAASVNEQGLIRHSSGRQPFDGQPDNRLTPRLARLADGLRRAVLQN